MTRARLDADGLEGSDAPSTGGERGAWNGAKGKIRNCRRPFRPARFLPRVLDEDGVLFLLPVHLPNQQRLKYFPTAQAADSTPSYPRENPVRLHLPEQKTNGQD